MNDIVDTEVAVGDRTEVAVEALPEVPATEVPVAPEVTEEGHVQVGEGPVATEILPL